MIENCDKAIALDRRYVKALLRRFKMHQALGHMEEALLGGSPHTLLPVVYTAAVDQYTLHMKYCHSLNVSPINSAQKFTSYSTSYFLYNCTSQTHTLFAVTSIICCKVLKQPAGTSRSILTL